VGFDRHTRDLDFGRGLPGLFEESGLWGLGHEGLTLTAQVGDPLARELVRERFIAAGVLTAADFDELRRAYDDRSFRFRGFTLFGAWGRRRI
jgi:hypothetical protein